MTDQRYRYYSEGEHVSDPANSAKVVVPSDGVDLPDGAPKAIYTGSGGDIAMIGVAEGEEAVTWVGTPPGAILPFRPARILVTGTTATDILALY